jgi:hypothetical protein
VVIAEYNNLIPVKVLVADPANHLQLFKNDEGNLFLCSNCNEPAGIVFYETTPVTFCDFLQGLITLQELFDRIPSLFVEINSRNKTALYSRMDVEVNLANGQKKIHHLVDHCPIEVW